METNLNPGDKVRTCYGKTRTVMLVIGCMVYVVEESNGWYHPSKLTKIN